MTERVETAARAPPQKCNNLACRYYGQYVCRCYPWMRRTVGEEGNKP